MRLFIVRATVVAVLVTGASLAIAFSSGPPPSRTGAPAVAAMPDEPNCADCHGGNPVNDAAGLLEILDLPDEYVPGTTYPMRVKLQYAHDPLPEFPLWGFELTAVRADDGTAAGSFVVPATLRILPGTVIPFTTRNYVQHRLSGTHEGQPGPVEWNFDWVAPTEDVGDVYFYAAGNAANGNGFISGDYIFTVGDTTTGSTVVGVPPRPITYHTMLAAPYPNPFHLCADLSFTIARAGHVDLSVFDMSGRRVRTIVRGWHDAGPGSAFWNGKHDDGRQAPNGVYFVRLKVEGEAAPVTRKITLAG